MEAHVADENGNEDGCKNFCCVLEAWMEGRKPVAVTNRADTLEQAILGATDKLKTALRTMFG